MEEQIKSIIADILSLTDEQIDNLTPETDLFEIGLDSMIAIELIVHLESEFDILIDDDDLSMDNVRKISEIISFVNKYKEC
ncbi:acyl carrier protein [uncultured Ruminococcus sp.]|uniref:acyl carrier protein n=1 Tax=uncultured Ruminococcus sp. TaxID=165186 RepID=UPI0025982481|nr:acyl carrier protein [uncultured Ruminococcus sp.]